MTSPANSATAVSTLPTYSWNPSTGAKRIGSKSPRISNFATLVLDHGDHRDLLYADDADPLARDDLLLARDRHRSRGDTPASPPSSFTTL